MDARRSALSLPSVVLHPGGSSRVYAASQELSKRRWRLDAVLAPGPHRRSQATPEVYGMDADRFDSLVRSLTGARSRRGALRGLLAGSLGLLGWSPAEDTTAKNCKKITNKAKRKKCLAKARGQTPVVPPSPCVPQCAATNACDGDGCGNSCGVCTAPTVCVGGSCVCPDGTKPCGSACILTAECCTNAE